MQSQVHAHTAKTEKGLEGQHIKLSLYDVITGEVTGL